MAQAALPLFADPAPTKADGIFRDAALSPCGTWRWTLSRHWRHTAPGCSVREGYLWGVIVGLNPSTADALVDDNTVVSLMKRARVWGWGGFEIVNLFAFRSPHPRDLLTAADPIGLENDARIEALFTAALSSGGQIVAMWGNSFDFSKAPAPIRGRDLALLRRMTARADVYCLAKNDDGSPRHALARGRMWTPEDAPLVLFATKAEPALAPLAPRPIHLEFVAAPPPAAPPREPAPVVEAAPPVPPRPPLPPPLPPEPEDALDRAWWRVAAECPAGATADAHRRGESPLVHVVPMGHPADVRCVEGEPVPGYAGFFRPAGGYRDLIPRSTRIPTDAELAAGARMPTPVYPRKTDAYDAAEKAGR